MKTITVLLADDHTIIRQGLRLVLEAWPGIEVVGEAEDGRQCVSEAKRLRPDVVLLDLAMPLLNGVEATRQITNEVPVTKVLVLSSYSDDQHLAQAIEAGASGYLPKEAAAEHLLQAIRVIAEGAAFFAPTISARLLEMRREAFLNGRPFRGEPTKLTSRQTEVLQLVAEGYANKQIAALLFISIKTVEKHRQLLMDKLNIHNISALTRYAVSRGVVESGRAPEWPLAAAQASPVEARQNPALSRMERPVP